MLNDTLINSRTYTKIFSENNGAYILYEGAFRNDVSGITYFLPPADTLPEESILQDFTKAVGDTVYNVSIHYGMYLGSFNFVVDSVRYYPCGPYTLKSVSLHNIEEIPYMGNFMLLHWLEKIGNTWGGVFNQANHTLNNYTLICHNASDTIFYTAPTLGNMPSPEYLVYRRGSCELYLPNEELVEAGEFSVYPNPFSEYFTISTVNYYNTIQLKVCDIMGRVVLTENIPSFSNNYKIEFPSFLPDGTYIIAINSKSKRIWKQIIVKR